MTAHLGTTKGLDMNDLSTNKAIIHLMDRLATAAKSWALVAHYMPIDVVEPYNMAIGMRDEMNGAIDFLSDCLG